LILVSIALWIMWATSQAYAEPIRAISAEQHAACDAMPRGSQVMEMERQECFNELYTTPYRLEHGR
jgi:hypothetical protein